MFYIASCVEYNCIFFIIIAALNHIEQMSAWANCDAVGID